MSALDPLVKLSSLVFIVFTLALALAILLPKFRRSKSYKLISTFFRPSLPYLGWVIFLIGSTWTTWGLFQDGGTKLISGLGVTWAVLGIYVIRVGYEAEPTDESNATDLKVISLCITFSLSFLFLLLYGSWITSLFR